MARKYSIKLNTSKDISYKDLHSMYIKKCKVNNLSSFTIKNYNDNYKVFNLFIDLENLKCSKITETLIDEYILFLKSKNLCDVTINSYIKFTQVIIKYGQSLGYICAFKISNYRYTEKIKVIYTEE